MNITYFQRSNECGPSIGKAFRYLIAEIGKTESVETFYEPSAKYNLKGIIKNIIFTFRHRNKKGINHVTGDCNFAVLGLIGCKSVLTIHDLGFYTNHKDSMSWGKRYLLYIFQIYLPILLADKVIAISEKTKEEILKIIPFKKKIDIVKHHSIDQFVYVPKELNKQDVLVLQNGTGSNKNLKTTIKALAKYREICKLRVVREMTVEQKLLAESLGVKYSNVFNLTDEQVRDEYVNADIVCMPSVYEGLGAITIEAQATGRPVITTNLEPMISVSGGAAHLLNNPTDEEEFAYAIGKIVFDDSYRKRLIELGLENAEKFKVSNCANEHILLYKSM